MNCLAGCFISGLIGAGTIAPAHAAEPKLVVGIVVDQLRSDYIENFRGLFGEKGFNRLLRDGVYLRDVDFKVKDLDAVSSTAILFSGSYPRHNGVTASKVYDENRRQFINALEDKNVIGNFTTETFSPVNLRVSTLSDEISSKGREKAAVYSIAPDAQQSVIMAGHAGTSAFWINENTGNWATTTYYLNSPQILTQRNYTNGIGSRLDAMPYSFPKSDRNVYKMYSVSPMVNEEVTDAAIEYIEKLGLGKRQDGTDMLNLAYTAAQYEYGDGSPEQLIDGYKRLDDQLGRLFETLDRTVGTENVVVFLSSTGYFEDQTPYAPELRIPTGTFSVKRAFSLLNSFLSARFGNGAYVETFGNNHVYLNHKTIEEKGLDAGRVAEEARDFLVKMSGVSDAFTMADIMTSALPSMEARRLAVDPKTSGDIIIEFNPGWVVSDDLSFPADTKLVRESPVLSPAFILSPALEPQVIEEKTDATAIAPTLASILRIRSPNGSRSQPLKLKAVKSN